jgi:hypothetical protein
MKYAEACARGVTVESEAEAERSTLNKATVDDPPAVEEFETVPEQPPRTRAKHRGAPSANGALKRPNILPVV